MKRTLLAACAVTAALAALALALPPGRAVTTQIIIDAPPARVWFVLTNWPANPAWNPTTRLAGDLRPGAIIENRVGLPGESQMVFHPTLRVVRPSRELRWSGRILLPHLFDANHFFLIRPTTGGTLFIQGEKLHGVALWFLDTTYLAAGFDAVNAALKARAEGK